MNINRRGFLAAAGLGALMDRVEGADLTKMIVHSARPSDLEMPLDGFSEWITPADRFFVRCHTYVPERVDLAAWKLSLDGEVSQPLSLSMEDLKKLPRVEQVSVLECAGNGRSLYQPHVAGTQWVFGAVGNGRWTGVRFRDVLAKAGLKPSARHLLLDGTDVALGTMPKFQRTITVEKAMDPDTLLAYEMNGEELPLDHGFPLRVIAPGWASDSWVKWLRHIQVLDHEFEGFWMKTAYRHPTHAVTPGASVDPSEMVPVTDLNIKSVIATPAAGLIKGGKVRISGAAWSNSSPVERVDVSVDGGETWKPAHLGKEHSRYAWRLFHYDWTASDGTHTLMARATNAAGQTQPREAAWNPSGYLWNAIQPVEVEVSGQQIIPIYENGPAAPEHPDGYQAACMACHDEGMMQQQHLTRAQWEREVGKMTGWGAKIRPEDREAILKYLSDNFK